MKKLSKEQSERKAEIIDRLRECEGKVSGAIVEYNEAVADAESLRDEVSAEQEDYRANRSDKWSEGEAGQAYAEWADNWRDESFEEMNDIEEDHAERLESLADELE